MLFYVDNWLKIFKELNKAVIRINKTYINRRQKINKKDRISKD